MDAIPLAFGPASPTLLPELSRTPDRRIDRKMSLIRRSGLFGANTKGAKISRAATLEDLREAYVLVHRVYTGTGYISKEDAAIRFRLFETQSHTATFIAKKDGRVVGVLSIVRDSTGFGLPSDEAFPGELKALRASGAKLVEVTNQAVHEDFRGTAVPTELMRCALAHSIEAGIDIGIAAVSPSHHSFYELLGFRKIGPERSYSGKVHDPVVPVQIELDAHRHPRGDMDEVERFMHSYLTGENPYFLYVQQWENAARAYFSEPHIIRGLLQECTEDQLAALREHTEKLTRKIAESTFVERLDGPRPNLRGLCEPQPDRYCVPAHVIEDARLRDIDASVACGRYALDRGLMDADLQGVRRGDELGSLPHESELSRAFWLGCSSENAKGNEHSRPHDFKAAALLYKGRSTPREAA